MLSSDPHTPPEGLGALVTPRLWIIPKPPTLGYGPSLLSHSGSFLRQKLTSENFRKLIFKQQVQQYSWLGIAVCTCVLHTHNTEAWRRGHCCSDWSNRGDDGVKEIWLLLGHRAGVGWAGFQPGGPSLEVHTHPRGADVWLMRKSIQANVSRGQ